MVGIPSLFSRFNNMEKKIMNKSKIKGNKFERDIVKAVELHDIKAVRAWGQPDKIRITPNLKTP